MSNESEKHPESAPEPVKLKRKYRVGGKAKNVHRPAGGNSGNAGRKFLRRQRGPR